MHGSRRRGRFRLIQQRFVADELVTVLLQNRTGESLTAQHEYALIVLFQFVEQGDEIAIPADDGECVDVIVREGHLQRIQRQVDVRAVLVAARRRVALHHLYGMLGHGAGGDFLPSPVGVGHAGDDFTALLQCIQHGGHVKFPMQCGFDADFDVIEVDEHGQFEFVFHLLPSEALDSGVAGWQSRQPPRKFARR